MKCFRILALFGLLLLRNNAFAAPAPGGDEYESVPKYGDPTYQTMWSHANAEERTKLREFSEHAAGRGFQYLGQGDLETAIRRFNQSWTMNPANPVALWGMALVQFERARRLDESQPASAHLALLDQAVALMDEAAALPSPESSLLNDEAMLLINRGSVRHFVRVPGRDDDFQRAETLLKRAEAIGTNPLIYENWAELERRRGNAQSAERYAAKARAMEAERRP